MNEEDPDCDDWQACIACHNISHINGHEPEEEEQPPSCTPSCEADVESPLASADEELTMRFF